MPESDSQALGATSRPRQIKTTKTQRGRNEPKAKATRADKNDPIQALVLIPLSYNDRSLIPQEVLDEILNQIYLFAGGHTINGIVKGTYKLASGDKCVEDLMEVMVVFKAGDKKQFETMVSEWASELGQESMLVTYTNYQVSFVEPSKRED
jgi:hypothetical protein